MRVAREVVTKARDLAHRRWGDRTIGQTRDSAELRRLEDQLIRKIVPIIDAWLLAVRRYYGYNKPTGRPRDKMYGVRRDVAITYPALLQYFSSLNDDEAWQPAAIINLIDGLIFNKKWDDHREAARKSLDRRSKEILARTARHERARQTIGVIVGMNEEAVNKLIRQMRRFMPSQRGDAHTGRRLS